MFQMEEKLHVLKSADFEVISLTVFKCNILFDCIKFLEVNL